ncbi:MAG: TonB-dependent siderophore receptor, partial [Pyrinomonadaceae bacterium]
NDPLDETWSALVGYQLTHRLNDAWTIHNRFHAAWANLYKNNVVPVSLQADGRSLDRNLNYQELPGEVYGTNLDLTGKFDLFGSRHDVLVGLDYYYDYYDYSSTSLADAPVSNPGFPGHSGNSHDPEISIDIFNPTYGGVDSAKFISVLTDPALKGFSTFAREQYGVYFQDHITFFDKLHILGGGRYDWADNEGTFSEESLADAKAAAPDKNEDEEFSPRVGILYQPWPWIGVYGSWSNSFGANNGRTASGDLVPPETGVQWETGVKTQLFDGALSATLVFYHLTKENVLTEDLSTPDDLTDVIPIGESRSQGIEVDVLGQITDEIGIIASYAYTDADVTKDNSGFEGTELRNVPLHSGSAFLTYDFKNYLALKGLRLGFGAFAVGSRQGDAENTFILPGYVRLDAFAGYSFNVGASRLTAQLNIENLADKDYFEGTDVYFNSGGRLGIFPGAPLTVIGSLRLEF